MGRNGGSGEERGHPPLTSFLIAREPTMTSYGGLGGSMGTFKIKNGVQDVWDAPEGEAKLKVLVYGAPFPLPAPPSPVNNLSFLI